MRTLTKFSAEAQRSRIYTFHLLDGGGPHPFDVVRNGQRASCTGALTLFMNPEDLTREYPARTTVTQTPHGAWVDSFGLGLPRWVMRGTTSWRARSADIGLSVTPEGNRVDGYLAFHAFSDLVEEYLRVNRQRTIEAVQTGSPTHAPLQMVFHDHWDDDFWVIEPEGLPIKRRGKDRPMLVDYEFRFTGLQNLKKKPQPEGQAASADPTGSALLGGPAREQLTAQALDTFTADLKAALDEVDTAAAASPGDASALDALTRQWISREPEFTPEDVGWTEEDLAMAVETAQPLPPPFDQVFVSDTGPSFLSQAKSLLERLKDFKNKVADFANGVSSFIASPFEGALNLVAGIRELANITAFGVNLQTLTARMRTALRQLRTAFRNILCAVQSILAFPYNFLRGLRDSLQAMLNLFKLSGCASTFPRIRDVSWRPSVQVTVPRPLGG